MTQTGPSLGVGACGGQCSIEGDLTMSLMEGRERQSQLEDQCGSDHPCLCSPSPPGWDCACSHLTSPAGYFPLFHSRLTAYHISVPASLSSPNCNECHPPGTLFKWNQYSPLFINSKREREGSHEKPKIQITENHHIWMRLWSDRLCKTFLPPSTLDGLRKSTLQRSKALHLFSLPKSSIVWCQVKRGASGNIPLRQPECGYSKAFRIG